MLEKTMKQMITKKINAWQATITDGVVRKAIEKDLILTGGCFTSMIQNESPKDYDCYFRTKETVLLVANYYARLWNDAHAGQKNKLGAGTKVFVLDCDAPSAEILDYFRVSDAKDSAAVLLSNGQPGRVKFVFPSDGVVGDPEAVRATEELGAAVENIAEIDETKADEVLAEEKKPYFPAFISSNAVALSNGIQVVVRFYGEPTKIHETYDFVHTKAYFDINEGVVQIPKEVYETVVNKTLRYTGSKYPVCSMFRTRKFIARGWTINAGQLLKIAMQISELDLNDINVLEDQLVGVDSLYFMQLIHQFQRQKQNDPEFKLTASYVESIIDKIF